MISHCRRCISQECLSFCCTNICISFSIHKRKWLYPSTGDVKYMSFGLPGTETIQTSWTSLQEIFCLLPPLPRLWSDYQYGTNVALAVSVICHTLVAGQISCLSDGRAGATSIHQLPAPHLVWKWKSLLLILALTIHPSPICTPSLLV